MLGLGLFRVPAVFFECVADGSGARRADYLGARKGIWNLSYPMDALKIFSTANLQGQN
jgi:hypothetical protein